MTSILFRNIDIADEIQFCIKKFYFRLNNYNLPYLL